MSYFYYYAYNVIHLSTIILNPSNIRLSFYYLLLGLKHSLSYKVTACGVLVHQPILQAGDLKNKKFKTLSFQKTTL